MSTHSIDAPFSIAQSSPASSRHDGTSQAFRVVASLAVTVLITAAGFLVIGLEPSTVTHSSVSAQAPIIRQAQPATMEIAASPAEVSPDAFFEGTGDGSAGGWTSPR